VSRATTKDAAAPDAPSHREGEPEPSFPHVESVLAAMETGPAPAVEQTFGIVESIGDVFSVRVGGATIVARRAASCLLEPGPGDQVLVALSDRASFVLAVLVQAPRPTPGGVLSLEGDVTLRSRQGKVAIVANEGIHITSASEIGLNAPDLNIRSLKTTIFSESLSYIGRRIDTEVERIKLAARAIDSAVDRVSARVKRSFRTVEEMEQVRAKELDIVVEGNASIHGENALVSADKLVKVDGEQVHLG
jgi:hypothetical protein